jgi:hypothetical protein
MICLIGRSDIGFPFYRGGSTQLGRVPHGPDNLSLHELHVEREGHLVANKYWTKKSGHLAARYAQQFSQDPQALPPQVA